MDRPKDDRMEPPLALPMTGYRDTEPCEPDEARRPTIPPTLEQLAAEADHHRMVREAAQEASGILSSTLMEILEGQREIDRKLGLLVEARERLSELEGRIERIERCCSRCPRSPDGAELGFADGHG